MVYCHSNAGSGVYLTAPFFNCIFPHPNLNDRKEDGHSGNCIAHSPHTVVREIGCITPCARHYPRFKQMLEGLHRILETIGGSSMLSKEAQTGRQKVNLKQRRFTLNYLIHFAAPCCNWTLSMSNSWMVQTGIPGRDVRYKRPYDSLKHTYFWDGDTCLVQRPLQLTIQTS